MLKKIVEFLNKPISKKTFFMGLLLMLIIFFSMINLWVYTHIENDYDIKEFKFLFIPETLMFLYGIFAYINSEKK